MDKRTFLKTLVATAGSLLIPASIVAASTKPRVVRPITYMNPQLVLTLHGRATNEMRHSLAHRRAFVQGVSEHILNHRGAVFSPIGSIRTKFHQVTDVMFCYYMPDSEVPSEYPFRSHFYFQPDAEGNWNFKRASFPGLYQHKYNPTVQRG